MLEKIPLREHLYIAGAVNLVLIFTVILLKNLIPPVVPILYGRPTGESQLLPTLGLIIPPAISLLILISNAIASTFAIDMFLKRILILAAFLTTLLTTITVLKVMFLVSSF